jgi:hypothetical protein
MTPTPTSPTTTTTFSLPAEGTMMEAVAETTVMTSLFKTLGFSEAAAKQMVRYEQIDNMEVLAKLTDKRCSNMVKNIRKVRVTGSKTRFLTVSDAALNRFQMAVYATKHVRRTNRRIKAHELDKAILIISGPSGKLKTRHARPSLHSRLD